MKRRKINNKGFTIVEILAVVVILGVLAVIAVPAVYKHVQKTEIQSYDTMAKSAKQGLESYLLENAANSGVVRIKDLIEDEYLEATIDPKDNSKICDGYIKYNLVEGTDGSLDQYEYTINLCCSNYQKTYKYPEGTKTDITPSNYCEALY